MDKRILKPYYHLGGNEIKVRLRRGSQTNYCLSEIKRDLAAKSILPPVVVHFESILIDQFSHINSLFQAKIRDSQYQGDYILSYPLKLSAKYHIIKSLNDASRELGKKSSYEVGSKAEFLVAISSSRKGSLIICHGVKDYVYLNLANIYAKKGVDVCVVIENEFEINLLRNFINISSVPAFSFDVGIRLPCWGNIESKYFKKFGLNILMIQQLSSLLKAHGLEEKLSLVNFHSQWQEKSQLIKQIQYSFKIIYELIKQGHPIQYLNCGGGVFLGKEENDEYYNIEKYSSEVVSWCKHYTDKFKVNPPTIITESGSALTYLSEVLLVDKIGESFDADAHTLATEQEWFESNESLHEYIEQPSSKSVDKKIWLDFSVFSSIPDVIINKKSFPIVSMGGENNALGDYVIFDTSCDPDGYIRNNKEYQLIKDSLEFAIFFVGPYQGMLSSNHNMLSNPKHIVVSLKDNKLSYHLGQLNSLEDQIKNFGHSIDRLSVELSDQEQIQLQQFLVRL